MASGILALGGWRLVSGRATLRVAIALEAGRLPRPVFLVHMRVACILALGPEVTRQGRVRLALVATFGSCSRTYALPQSVPPSSKHDALLLIPLSRRCPDLVPARVAPAPRYAYPRSRR